MSVEVVLIEYRVVVGERLGETRQASRRDLLQSGLVRLVTNAADVDCHAIVRVVHRRLLNNTVVYVQGNGIAAEVLLKRDHPRVVPIGAHRKRSYSISNIGIMMGCDHPSCVPVGPLTGELWHFEFFPTTTVRHFEF